MTTTYEFSRVIDGFAPGHVRGSIETDGTMGEWGDVSHILSYTISESVGGQFAAYFGGGGLCHGLIATDSLLYGGLADYGIQLGTWSVSGPCPSCYESVMVGSAAAFTSRVTFSASAVVPEPGTGPLVMVALLFAALVRRRSS